MSEDITINEAIEEVNEIMFTIVSLLNSYGIMDVRAGALMRLLGTADVEAEQFDNKVMFIDGDLLDMRDADEIPGEVVQEDIDPGRTLH
jgi:hypothetical protein